MSNPLAVAAVTATLRRLLQAGLDADPDPDLAGVLVTTKAPDKARGPGDTGNQLNVFLYQTTVDAAWRNRDLPGTVKPGERGFPPLPMVLHYLLTAYGRDNDDVRGHHVLGRALAVLHDHPLLSPAEIEMALPASDLADQVERVRLTPEPLSVEELSKLWSSFQTNYRISAGYQASPILIESARSALAAPPVLRRGEQDRGPVAVGGPPAELGSAQPTTGWSAVRLGEQALLLGRSLAEGTVTARLANPRLAAEVSLPVTVETPERLRLTIPALADDPTAFTRWVPGFYGLSLLIQRPDLPAWTTNEVPLALAPRITRSPAGVSPGDPLTVTCAPRVRTGQKVLLIVGGHQVTPDNVANPGDPAQPTTLTFTVPALAAGEHLVRLRVDGVDSLPFVLTGSPPLLSFDPDQKVTVP
ncbi:MAG TPA: DUF4255 domain-containing protein [Thermoanaerobaculia bacterium]|nr:DUF4255 domain-containing protein [Thermoanaerobaculia bacterium]